MKDFQVITCFSLQRIYYITIAFSFRDISAEKIYSLSNNEQTSAAQQRALCLSKRRYIYRNASNNPLHNCVCELLSIKIEIYSRNHCRERWSKIALILDRDVKVSYEKEV